MKFAPGAESRAEQGQISMSRVRLRPASSDGQWPWSAPWSPGQPGHMEPGLPTDAAPVTLLTHPTRVKTIPFKTRGYSSMKVNCVSAKHIQKCFEHNSQ